MKRLLALALALGMMLTVMSVGVFAAAPAALATATTGSYTSEDDVVLEGTYTNLHLKMDHAHSLIARGNVVLNYTDTDAGAAAAIVFAGNHDNTVTGNLTINGLKRTGDAGAIEIATFLRLDGAQMTFTDIDAKRVIWFGADATMELDASRVVIDNNKKIGWGAVSSQSKEAAAHLLLSNASQFIVTNNSGGTQFSGYYTIEVTGGSLLDVSNNAGNGANTVTLEVSGGSTARVNGNGDNGFTGNGFTVIEGSTLYANGNGGNGITCQPGETVPVCCVTVSGNSRIEACDNRMKAPPKGAAYGIATGKLIVTDSTIVANGNGDEGFLINRGNANTITGNSFVSVTQNGRQDTEATGGIVFSGRYPTVPESTLTIGAGVTLNISGHAKLSDAAKARVIFAPGSIINHVATDDRVDIPDTRNTAADGSELTEAEKAQMAAVSETTTAISEVVSVLEAAAAGDAEAIKKIARVSETVTTAAGETITAAVISIDSTVMPTIPWYLGDAMSGQSLLLKVKTADGYVYLNTALIPKCGANRIFWPMSYLIEMFGITK